MKNKFFLLFCLLCITGLTVFADDYGSQCRDDSQVVCRDQRPTTVTYNNQDFVQSQQNQQNQRATYQPMQPTYQPMNNYLNFPQQNMQAMVPAYNSYTPGMNNFEQQRVAVDTVNQMNFASVTAPQRDFSNVTPTEDPMELSRKIKEAAQNSTQDTQGY